MKTELNEYPERWVRAECVKLYDAPICDRTWRRYKRICKVPDARKTPKGSEPSISKTHCQWLMMLAYMKFEQKTENSTKPLRGTAAKITLEQVVMKLNSSPLLTRRLGEAMGDAVLIEGIKGKEVPLWLNRQIGRSPTIATLRRWAKKHNLEFSTHLPVPTKTLDKFLQMA